jgi:DNA polymerase I
MPDALIDAELYLFRAAAASQYEEEWAPDEWTYVCRHGEARAHFQDQMAEIKGRLPDHDLVLCFGDSASFRYSLWPTYKANRKTNRKPAGYGKLLEWAKESAEGRGWRVFKRVAPPLGLGTMAEVEGDDMLGLAYAPGDVIVSEDKDMLSLPGLHLRGLGLLGGAGELVEVSQAEADRWFFTQTLTGDSADNYPGCSGIGAVKAAKILEGLKDPVVMWKHTLAAFIKAGHSEQFAITQARCARILRAGEYGWDAVTGESGPILWTPPIL